MTCSMASQENGDLSYVENPFIKPQNKQWELAAPKVSPVDISPPRRSIVNSKAPDVPNETAAIEAGELKIRNHLEYFSAELSKHVRDGSTHVKLPIKDFGRLYERNQNESGHHFVIHQHDHPVAGTHYDLRLQFSASSSISFACMYGMPGNVNSKRLNRNATETRVHNLYNHLIETASHSTGSLMIWDTGEYEILPRRSKHAPIVDPDSASSDSDDPEIDSSRKMTEADKLAAAFQNRKIKLRLHGTKLPKNYTLSLRLTKAENRHEQPKKPVRKRRRRNPNSARILKETPPASDDEGGEDGQDDFVASQPPASSEISTALERELQEQEDEQVRLTNAYPGATNTIGSIHQRKWYLSMDRVASGFYKAQRSPVRWERQRAADGKLLGFEAFFVKGRDHEVSVVTGRTADEIMEDEGVTGYIGRKGWRAVME